MILNVDCLLGLKSFPDASFDSIVTDPPYELGFMGKSWDSTGIAYNVEVWKECLRVLKPGGYLLAFSGARTYHRMACAIEDAGFDIRDQIMWVYGSGFPKSHNLSGEHEGWGTALKPAHEPIVMARKKLIGTIQNNMNVYGTGAINVDKCRIEAQSEKDLKEIQSARPSKTSNDYTLNHGSLEGFDRSNRDHITGRWPANIIHDGSDEVVALFPNSKGQQGNVTGNEASNVTNGIYGEFNNRVPFNKRDDNGSAARFFYCAKASKFDRDEGLENFTSETVSDGRTIPADKHYQRGATLRKNIHPTVKPTELMRYLCRLVTPVNGSILDPFAGSGSTGKAAILENFIFIGFELSKEYSEIAQARIDAVKINT